MKKIFTVLAAVMTICGLSAENYFLKSTWGQSEASWKQMIEDDGSYIFEGDVFFDGNDIAINTVASDEGARIIKVENIDATINYVEKAELAAGDSVFFVYVPDMYNQFNEKESGLMAMINWKNGYAIKYDAAWKNMAKDDETFVLFNAAYAGKDVQIVSGNQIRAIKAENINAMLNYDAAELAAGDSVMYVYDPEAYSQYDEKQSGLFAMITWKNGYAILENGTWKNMLDDDPEDHDWWIFEKTEFNGKAVQIVTENQIRAIEPKNIEAYINYDAAELSAGDTVMYVYRPSLYNRYDETQSGMYAHILAKNGYAMLGTWGEQFASWKNMILDAAQEDETYVLDSVIFDGNDVQFISNEGIRVIKVANIPALLMEDYSEATLEEGDLVMFVYTPDTYSHYDETKSGLMALIYEKNQGEGFESIAVEGKAVKVIVNGQMMIIKNGQMYNATGVLVK
jgi:hypothetical protein